ncbi:hypothetical protein ACFFWD_06585 [Bradyrhizobium erythrophlei]|uniref:hypothetical protein n=1 Tax=Bradyrhizobium erythrophlei TaxID=1437360 RepID=UPI0035E75045
MLGTSIAAAANVTVYFLGYGLSKFHSDFISEPLKILPIYATIAMGAFIVFSIAKLSLAIALRKLAGRKPNPFDSKIRQAPKYKWKKTTEVPHDGTEAPFTKRSVRFIRGKEEAVLWHKDAKITLVRLNVPFEFEDFVELEEFIATHPREDDLDNTTGETRYSREMELFFVRHRCSDDMMHIQATDYEFLVAFAKLRKAAYAAGEASVVVAGYVLYAVVQFYNKDRKRAIRWLTSQADDYVRGSASEI